MGPQVASCPWLYRNATAASLRWARRPPHARGFTTMPPLLLVRWARGSPDSHNSTQCQTDYGRLTRRSPTTHSRTLRSHSLAAYRSARRSPHAHGCTTMPAPLLAGGPAGRLIPETVPNARPPFGRRARMSHKTYGRTEHSHRPTAYGGPAGRLMPVAAPHFQPCSSWVGPPVAYFT